MVGFENFVEPVLKPEVVSILEMNKSTGFNYLIWIIYPLAIVLILAIAFFIIRFFARRSTLPLGFRELIDRGNISLKNKDVESAKKVYAQMKRMSEEKPNREMSLASLDFYSRLVKLIDGGNL
jgi:hypothetical protein